MRRCEATKANGEPCQAPESMVNDRGFCPAHDPEREEKRLEAARAGGRATARKLKRKGLEDGELPPLTTPQDAERWLETVARAVATGRLGHHEGRTVMRAVREFLRAHDAGEVSETLAALMSALETWKESGDETPVLELIEAKGA